MTCAALLDAQLDEIERHLASMQRLVDETLVQLISLQRALLEQAEERKS